MRTRPYYYILGDHFEIISVDDILTWGKWFETADRHVAKTKVGDIEVSTVFLGLDHNFLGDGPPILWETMIFGLESNEALYEYQERYETFDEAKAGHERAVALIKEKSTGV